MAKTITIRTRSGEKTTFPLDATALEMTPDECASKFHDAWNFANTNSLVLHHKIYYASEIESFAFA